MCGRRNITQTKEDDSHRIVAIHREDQSPTYLGIYLFKLLISLSLSLLLVFASLLDFPHYCTCLANFAQKPPKNLKQKKKCCPAVSIETRPSTSPISLRFDEAHHNTSTTPPPLLPDTNGTDEIMATEINTLMVEGTFAGMPCLRGSE